MDIFEKLIALREVQRRYLPWLRTIEDFDIVRYIGYHETRKPVTYRLLLEHDIGSVATVQRRLRRLKRLGVVKEKASREDGRRLELTLAPKVRRAYERKRRLLAK